MLQEIRQTLRVRDINQVKSALQFWQAKGVVAQVHSTSAQGELDEPVWTLLETSPTQVEGDPVTAAAAMLPSQSGNAPTDISAGIERSATIDPQAAFEAVQPFWGFIQNALANLHSLPSSRLQKMMTSLAPGYAGRSLEELEAFLEVARSEGLLVKGKDGFWRLTAM